MGIVSWQRGCGILADMNKATLFGLLLGFGGILLGNILEGGHTSSLMQLTAFIIVMTGTFGAVMVSSSEKDLSVGMSLVKVAFRKEERASQELIAEIVECSRIAKKETLLSLEPRIARIKNPFLKDILKNVVDGVEVNEIRDIFETRIDSEEAELLGGAKIWQDAGGFAPTIGIIGAVLGLIHVMGNLTDTSKLGSGIAVAFVATVYGVASANLLFLPLGNKLKAYTKQVAKDRQMVLEGGLMIAQGINPLVIEQKLKAFEHVSNS